MITVTLVVLAVAAGLFFLRLVLGPSLADRVLAIDGLVVTGIAAVVVDAVRTGVGSFIPVAVVFTLVGFVSTSVIARFIEGQDG